MRIGDLVKVSEDSCGESCQCFFCFHDSIRLGIVLEVWVGEDDETCCIIECDAGEWTFRGNEVEKDLEVIGEINDACNND